jgi:hypothetical protein
MDPLDLLEQLGRVEPADPDVLERAAARFLTASAGQRNGAGLRAEFPDPGVLPG